MTRLSAGVRWCALGLALAAGSSSARAQSGQNLAASAETRRSIAAYSFFAARLSLRQRRLQYEDGAAAGPSSRNQAELHLSGQWRLGPTGPLSAWVQGSVIGRLAADDTLALQDPLRSPMDDFGRQNLRLTSAFVDYTHRDDEGRARWSVSAGRQSDLNAGGLLLYDGARFALLAKRGLRLGAYVGQRANLDRGFINGRSDVSARMVAGFNSDFVRNNFRLGAGYRFEDVHVPFVTARFTDDILSLGLRIEGILGGRDAAQRDLDDRGAEEGLGAALRMIFDADARLFSGGTWGFVRVEGQLGTDPRGFGRGGRAARPEDLETALSVQPALAALGRLFLGASTPHVASELGLVQRLGGALELNLQSYLRIPVGAASLTGYRPRVIEVWGGPSAYWASGARVSLDARAAFQDPGEVQTLFTRAGDGERQRLGLELNAELPIAFDEWVLALRPQAAGYRVTTEGAGALAEGQLEFAGGASAVVAYNSWWGALRYEGATTPSFGGTGVRALHEIEIAIGGGW